jgi:predicted N-acetyltransferase YhbS
VITADELPDKLAKRLPRYPQLPVILLGGLAVDLSCKGRGLGEFLLMDALRRSAESAADITAMAVVVDAKDAAAASFYEHFGFTQLQQRPGRSLYYSYLDVASAGRAVLELDAAGAAAEPRSGGIFIPS